MKKPTILMVKINAQANSQFAEERLDAALTKTAKIRGVCYFFDDPEAASAAIQNNARLLGKDDEFVILPISPDTEALVAFGNASTIGLTSVGLTSFRIPFVNPDRGDGLFGAPQ
jgi:hypothetical protein